MTDRVVNKEKITSSSKTNNDAVHHSSHHHHRQSASQQKDPPSRSHEENFTNDTFVKRYKVIEKIGEGSYSEVLKCQNRRDGTTVACKRLKHIYKSLEDVANISEIATLRSIQKHSNILQMIEIHFDKILGKVSLVFELMDINLYELIKDRKRLLPESRVRAIMFQLFRALRHLHKLGVFHRDIKPENILIKAKTDQLKLGDLGSVRGMLSRPPYTEYISTRWYRSPECLLTAGHYSHKMDIWAAGCVFYEVLTLRPLFPGSSEIDQINRINNVLGPPPLKLLETFQKQSEMERETYRGQSQLNRRQQIQKVLNNYSSRYMVTGDGSNKSFSNNSIKSYRRNNMEFHFAGKEGTGLEKILPAHITREAKEIIKSCLLYDPETRPTAQRIVQLSYFSELRESYSKNPEKVSSKSVLLICGDTVTDQCTPIELSTLGDHKIRFRRLSQKTTAKPSASKLLLEKKSSSVKSTDINNNYRRRTPSSIENVVQVARKSQSRLSGVANSSTSKMKVIEQRSKLTKGDVSREGKSSLTSNVTRASRIINAASTGQSESTRVPSSKVNARSKNSILATQAAIAQQLSHKRPESFKKKQQQQQPVTSSTSSFESVHSPEKNVGRKYSRQRAQSVSKEAKAALLNLPDISLSPYVKPPSELKFLRNKIKSDQHPRKIVPPPLMTQQNPQPPPVQKSNNVEQPQHHSNNVRVSVVPPKVAAAAIKYAKANTNRKIRPDPVIPVDNHVTDQTESSGTNTGGGGAYSATDDTTSYATASSVKIGKLRFRQTSQQSSQPPSRTTKKEAPVTLPTSLQRSKIPVLTDDQFATPQSSRRNTKLLSSPPEQRHESGTTEKWRNTGIPRMIPMSPERERNIQLLKESLMLDKNKRVKLRYQQQQQDLLNNNVKGIPPKRSSSILQVGGVSRTKKGDTTKTKYDYTSQDTLQSTGEQQQGGNFSSAGGVGSKYRNSTTDYENPDVQETSSASAAALENQQRNIFNAAMRKGRVAVPPLESVMKKPSVTKKSSDLYPPEMLHLYSSRYRGPDTNMNILKDSGNSYVKRSKPESRTQEVKEKLNHKFEQRRQRQVNNTSSGHQVGEQQSKIISERERNYGHYPSSFVGAGEEEQFSRVAAMGSSRMERRPPLPPVGGGGGGGRGGNPRGYSRGVSPEVRQQYHRHRERKTSMIATTGAEKGSSEQPNRRSLSNAAGEQIRKDVKDSARKKAERMRSTMRDDVFCSSDDDVVISMRKKFDSLISERARKLSESLKTNQADLVNEPVRSNPPARKARDSNSEEDMVSMNRRSRNTADKSKKYARRELRARMAESLTMNNFSMEDNWRASERGPAATRLENRASNDSGDWMLPSSKYTTDKSGGKVISGVGGGTRNENSLASSYNPSSVLRTRKNNAENEFQESLKYHPTSRIHPFPIQEQHLFRRGQIFTPPANKPVYQSPQLGTMLQDRKLRYSHNNPMSVTGNYGNNPRKGMKNVDNLKIRQRI